MKESIRTIETVESRTLDIPQNGIVSAVLVDNLVEFVDIFYKEPGQRGVFEILAELESKVRYQKTRKLDPGISVKCSPTSDVTFNLIDLEYSDKGGSSPEQYVAVYTVSGIS